MTFDVLQVKDDLLLVPDAVWVDISGNPLEQQLHYARNELDVALEATRGNSAVGFFDSESGKMALSSD